MRPIAVIAGQKLRNEPEFKLLRMPRGMSVLPRPDLVLPRMVGPHGFAPRFVGDVNATEL